MERLSWRQQELRTDGGEFELLRNVAGLRSSPPKLGGVAAPSRKCCEATEAGRRRGGCLRNHPAVR